ncbi:DUF5684 domain-containing protein [uncultured Microbacterium sp.]|uniref:DUF5684 domain-containing protein n=1 Tax=uncultured Microbacterium sp. TaxID=191216 RepID=UPI0028D154B9|nr:DUF5684 domain-containing protein [uncultured Microbacterium sp.]
MNTDDSTGIALGLISFLLFVALYVWTALALSAVFRKSGERSWKAWVPFLNLATLLQLGGFSGWLVLLVLVPFAGQLVVWVLLIAACYRVNVAFGHGVGMTVLAALVLPVWASILGFGPARWLGTDLVGRGASSGPRRSMGPSDADEYVPRAAPPAYTPSAPLFDQPSAGWAPSPGRESPPLPSWLPAPPASALDQPVASADLQGAASTGFEPEPAPAPGGGRWGGFDLGAVSELTSEATGADSAAPAPVAAAPMRPAGYEPAVARPPVPEPPVTAPPPPVTRVPLTPAAAVDDEPWAPARSPMVTDPFPETSGPVSAIVGAPDGGTPRSARASVSAQHARPEIPDDPMDATIITRRRRTAWSLVPPSGAPVPLTSDVVLLGRKPAPDRAHPGAQLVAIDDGTVSKTHARLALREDHWYVTDLGSTNGVLFATLMGTEVEAAPGEEIEAGERFFLGDAEVRLQRSDG